MSYWKDLGERVAVTFVEAFVGAAVITDVADLTDHTMWTNAAMAGVAAVVSLVKGLVARHRGLEDSASLSKGV